MKIQFTEEEVKEIVKAHALRQFSSETISEIKDMPISLEDQKPMIIWPAQCSCGHMFLEKYQWEKPNDKNEVGFCWCGFCKTKRMVKPCQ